MKYYNRSLDCADDLDVEEVLTAIDLSKDGGARDDLLGLIMFTLDRTLFGDPCTHHRSLLESLGKDDAIISFNWDLLVDNIVSSSNQKQPDYSIPEESLKVSLNESPSNGSLCCLPFKPKLLKLHGSMNWMDCRKCKIVNVYLLDGKTAAEWYIEHREKACSCGSPMNPLIIAPTLLKSYKARPFGSVWTEATRVLAKADEIIVVGYSLPVTDLRAKWLFRESTAGERPIHILLFDKSPEEDKLRRWREVLHNRSIDAETGGIREAAKYLVGVR